MDIRCPRCSEPWDIDSLHDGADEFGSTFDEMRDAFRRFGCGAMNNGPEGPGCPRPATPEGDIAALALDLMGDDIDGAASMLEDAEFLGLL